MERSCCWIGSKRFVKQIVAFVLLVISLYAWIEYRTDGFSLSKIQGQMFPGASLPLSHECEQALHQSYHYLGKGHQCFVFVSEDQKYVIKFLNYRRFSLPVFLKILPRSLDWARQQEERRASRFVSLVQSYELAYEKLPQETQLIGLHFRQGGDMPVLRAVDRAHRIHDIDLNQTAFVVQKKATMIFDELERRYQKNPTIGFKRELEAFLHFLTVRCDLFIADDDRDVAINFGFCGDDLILLDPGRLYVDPTLQSKERREREIRVASKRLRRWLLKNHFDQVATWDELGSEKQ